MFVNNMDYCQPKLLIDPKFSTYFIFFSLIASLNSKSSWFCNFLHFLNKSPTQFHKSSQNFQILLFDWSWVGLLT